MKITSAAANKLLKQYNEKLAQLYQQEDQCSTYVEVEGTTPVVPEYDFGKTREEALILRKQVCTLKHAINQFNVTTTVDNTGLTIDQVLVKLAMLNKEKLRLQAMRSRQPKSLKSGFGARNNVIEYDIANFKIDDAAACYERVDEEINKLQLALDVVNNTAVFEVDI